MVYLSNVLIADAYAVSINHAVRIYWTFIISGLIIVLDDTHPLICGRDGGLKTMPKTMFEKIWESHVVREDEGQPSLIYIDLHLVHEVTSPQAFEGLRLTGRKVRRP